MEKDAFYFPHFSNARTDRKLRRVRKELGIEGYGIYFMVLEVLREQKGFKYPIDDIDLLADEFQTSEQKVRTVVCNYGLFETDEVNFFSIKFNKYLEPYITNKYKKTISGIRGNLIRYNHITKEQSKEMTDQQVVEINKNIKDLAVRSLSDSECDSDAIAIKVKQSKANKSKANNNVRDFSNEKFKPLSLLLRDKILDKSPNAIIKESQLKSWCNDFRLMIERDKRSYDQIEKLINDVFLDEFWSKNIKSASKLRKQLNNGNLDNLNSSANKKSNNNSFFTDEEFIKQYGQDVFEQLRG